MAKKNHKAKTLSPTSKVDEICVVVGPGEALERVKLLLRRVLRDDEAEGERSEAESLSEEFATATEVGFILDRRGFFEPSIV